ncbi:MULTISPECIES: helix-turn-helix domain-containing protein [unclassified Streptomyces]|uniref:helix-turn-helix domain-containing protein n=1 Tax=unclassified Streptomyces TaxID=2593676 RepID=UPI002E3403B3|nr:MULTISPECIES: helix-turn-helix domain-containing protein [unclassified Streptomyces]
MTTAQLHALPLTRATEPVPAAPGAIPVSPGATPVPPGAVVVAPESSQVGALIRAHRLRIGLTQRELADLSTISVRAIRDLEQGKARRPRPDTVRLMADALRLGPRARTALEAAAQQGRGGGHGLAEPPAPPTALHAVVGREAETGVLTDELGSGSERLVHVVGLTGMGKTRLALEVADRLHATGMPVLWHAFRGASADHLGPDEGPWSARVAAAVSALCSTAPDGIAGIAGIAGGGDAMAGLAELLGEQPALLVLDGAPAGPPRFERLTGLLRSCPGLRLLVTSDQPWRIPGERIFLLSPLEVPAEGAVDDTAVPASVQVFLGHLRRVRPEFVPGPADLRSASRVCLGLDGHPGALAAAASWLVVCDLAALCDSLDADPTALLDHLGGGDGAEDFRRALRLRLDRLPEDASALLDALCGRPAVGFELGDITALTGRSLPECGRMLRELLLAGVVRATHEGGGSRFRVLGLVRAVRRGRAVTAARA